MQLCNKDVRIIIKQESQSGIEYIYLQRITTLNITKITRENVKPSSCTLIISIYI